MDPCVTFLEGWARRVKPSLISGRSNQTCGTQLVASVRPSLIPGRSNHARVGRRRPFSSRRWRKRICGFLLFGLVQGTFVNSGPFEPNMVVYVCFVCPMFVNSRSFQRRSSWPAAPILEPPLAETSLRISAVWLECRLFRACHPSP